VEGDKPRQRLPRRVVQAKGARRLLHNLDRRPRRQAQELAAVGCSVHQGNHVGRRAELEMDR
jgi:hypothetical protein